MRILDRYINVSIIRIFFSTVFIFTFMYILIDATSNLDDFIERKLSIDVLLRYYLASSPIILVQTSSIACLISVLLTFSGLNNNNEIVAMRSSGLNFWQITKPALFFGLLISCLVFWLSETYVPKANTQVREIKNEKMTLEVDAIRRKKEMVKNLTFYGLKNRLYFVDTFDPNTNELSGITIIEHDENTVIQQKIVALKGVWTGIAWKFYQCQVTSYTEGGVNAPVKVKVYQEKLMDIKETPDDFLKQRIRVSQMNINELRQYIERFSKSGATKAIINLKVDLHQKIAYPIGNFVIVLLGLPFALMVKNRKGMTFTTVGIAVAIGFLYYVINAVCLAFGKGGLFPPILAAWASPIVFSGLALAVIETNFSN